MSRFCFLVFLSPANLPQKFRESSTWSIRRIRHRKRATSTRSAAAVVVSTSRKHPPTGCMPDGVSKCRFSSLFIKTPWSRVPCWFLSQYPSVPRGEVRALGVSDAEFRRSCLSTSNFQTRSWDSTARVCLFRSNRLQSRQVITLSFFTAVGRMIHQKGNKHVKAARAETAKHRRITVSGYATYAHRTTPVAHRG